MSTKRKSDGEDSESKRFQSEEYLTLLGLLLSHTSFRLWVQLSRMNKSTREHLPKLFLGKTTDMPVSPELYFTAMQLCKFKYITEDDHKRLLNANSVTCLDCRPHGHDGTVSPTLTVSLLWRTRDWCSTVPSILAVAHKVDPVLLSWLYREILPGLPVRDIFTDLPYRHYQFINPRDLIGTNLSEYSRGLEYFARFAVHSEYDHQQLLLQFLDSAALHNLDFYTIEQLFKAGQLRGEFFCARVIALQSRWPEFTITQLQKLARLVYIKPKMTNAIEPEVMLILDQKFKFDDDTIRDIVSSHFRYCGINFANDFHMNGFNFNTELVLSIKINVLLFPRLVERTLHRIFIRKDFLIGRKYIIIEWVRMVLERYPQFKEHIDFLVDELCRRFGDQNARRLVGRVYYPNLPPSDLLGYGTDLSTVDQYTLMYNCLCLMH